MTKSTHSEFETKVKQSLDNREDRLDNATEQQLKTMRQQAMQQSQQPTVVNWLDDVVEWLKKPAGNMVLASVLAIAIILPQLNHQQPYADQNMHQTALLDLIEAPEGESLDETADPDFYLWLAEVDGQNA